MQSGQPKQTCTTGNELDSLKYYCTSRILWNQRGHPVHNLRTKSSNYGLLIKSSQLQRQNQNFQALLVPSWQANHTFTRHIDTKQNTTTPHTHTRPDDIEATKPTNLLACNTCLHISTNKRVAFRSYQLGCDMRELMYPSQPLAWMQTPAFLQAPAKNEQKPKNTQTKLKHLPRTEVSQASTTCKTSI